MKEANEKMTDNAIMRYHLGMAYFKNGDKELAKKELRRALELDPKLSNAEEAKGILQQLR